MGIEQVSIKGKITLFIYYYQISCIQQKTAVTNSGCCFHISCMARDLLQLLVEGIDFFYDQLQFSLDALNLLIHVIDEVVALLG